MTGAIELPMGEDIYNKLCRYYLVKRLYVQFHFLLCVNTHRGCGLHVVGGKRLYAGIYFCGRQHACTCAIHEIKVLTKMSTLYV